MSVFGVDVSEWQPDFDFVAARRDGIEFAILRTNDGGYRDRRYARHYQFARAAGLDCLAAYCFCRNPSEGVPIEAQVNTALSVMGENQLPVWLDCETDAGLSAAHIREFKQQFEANGIRVIGVYSYVPWWEGRVIGGEPDSHEFGNFWVAAYGSNAVESPQDGYARRGGDDARQWTYPLGNQMPALWQFSSNGVAAGRNGNLDVNAFRGTIEELYSIFYGKESSMSDINRPVQSLIDGNVNFSDFVELLRVIDKNAWENNVMLRGLAQAQGWNPDDMFNAAKAGA